MNFSDKLVSAIEDKSPICVGIDPVVENIPNYIKENAVEEFGNTAEAVAAAFIEFSSAIIEATYDLVPVIKPQLAFFENYGSYGIQAFEEICQYAKSKDLLVIADAKRNDIGSTAKAYAQGFLGKSPLIQGDLNVNEVDAVTVNPYLGSDNILPFLEEAQQNNKGIFILVKTSNPSSGEIQDLTVGDEMIHEKVAHLVNSWGQNILGKKGFSSVGAVVGATYPEEAAYLRSIMPQQIFLVPGYGAQGGGAKDVKPCFTKEGQGAIINSSRGIIFAYKKNEKYSEKNFAEAAREAVLAMKEDLRCVSL